MASKSTSALALFLALNLLFFATLINACGSCSPKPKQTPTWSPGFPGSGSPSAPGSGRPSAPGSGRPSAPGSGGPSAPGSGGPSAPGSGSPSAPGTPSGGTSSGSCPRDALKLGVCANLLGGLINVTIGTPPVTPCCTLIQGLADLEAAVCLCTAIRANILGINLNLPISLSLLLNVCSRTAPRGFQCA